MKLKFKLCEASSFTKSKKVELLTGLDLELDDKIVIGQNFNMDFGSTVVKDKAVEVYKDKSGEASKTRLCVVGKDAVYIVEFIEEIKESISQISIDEYNSEVK